MHKVSSNDGCCTLKIQRLKPYLNHFEEIQVEGTDIKVFELQCIDYHGPTLLVKFQGCQHDPDSLHAPIVGAHSLADHFVHCPRAGATIRTGDVST